MTKNSSNYAKVLLELVLELDLSEGIVLESFEKLLGSELLLEALDNPAVSPDEKHRIIDRLFDGKIAVFIKVVCDNSDVDCFDEIFMEYKRLLLENKNGISARLICFEKPDDERIEKIKANICSMYNKEKAELEIIEDKSVLGGFILAVGDYEYDRSIRGALREIKNKIAWR